MNQALAEMHANSLEERLVAAFKATRFLTSNEQSILKTMLNNPDRAEGIATCAAATLEHDLLVGAARRASKLSKSVGPSAAKN